MDQDRFQNIGHAFEASKYQVEVYRDVSECPVSHMQSDLHPLDSLRLEACKHLHTQPLSSQMAGQLEIISYVQKCMIVYLWCEVQTSSWCGDYENRNDGEREVERETERTWLIPVAQ